MAVDRNEMARLHEEFLAELNGGRDSRGSGQTWQDQGDGRNNRITTEFAFAWDGKATRGKSITVDRAMIDKIREQAAGERPEIGLRWYDTDDLRRVGEDWVAIPAADYGELLAAGRLAAEAENSLVEAGRLQAEARAVIAAHAPPRPGPPPRAVLGSPFPDDLPPPLPVMWPCLVIDARHEEAGAGELRSKGYWVTDDGTVSDYAGGIGSVRYDTGMGEMRLYANDVRVLRGQLYIDRVLRVTVGA